MCCLWTVLVFLGPRIASIIWWIVEPARWVGVAFDSALWPILGILFLPWTTLMYVLVAPGGVVGWDWLWLGIVFLGDLGMYAGCGNGCPGTPTHPVVFYLGRLSGRRSTERRSHGRQQNPRCARECRWLLLHAAESNWLRTVPGKGWFTLFRLYSPTEAFFDKNWRPGDFERIG